MAANTSEYILLRSSEGSRRKGNGSILVFCVSSSSSVGYAEGYAEDCGVVEVLAIIDLAGLLGRGGCCISGTMAGCGAAADRLLPRGRLLACIVKVGGFYRN